MRDSTSTGLLHLNDPKPCSGSWPWQEVHHRRRDQPTSSRNCRSCRSCRNCRRCIRWKVFHTSTTWHVPLRCPHCAAGHRRSLPGILEKPGHPAVADGAKDGKVTLLSSSLEFLYSSAQASHAKPSLQGGRGRLVEKVTGNPINSFKKR